MRSSITRVEMHGADGNDYEKLHFHMKMLGFKRTILARNGVEYHLPSATYEKTSALSLDEVLDVAAIAAGMVGKEYELHCIDFVSWKARNLRPVVNTGLTSLARLAEGLKNYHL